MAAAGDDEGLIVSNSIKVLTQNGVCQIDLCLGDITRLKKEDEVDVLVVSAFRGDYTESKTSVLGALSRNLNVSVATLAKDKEEDLRPLYSCWWSKPLSAQLAFKRVLCFETRGKRLDGRPQELVANVFRCLVSILKDEDGSVITPLVNTGDQGYGEVSMLTGMVEGAVNWMKAGLPLRFLKLVLYVKVVDGEIRKNTMRRFDEVIQRFNDLKERYEMQLLLPKAVPLEYDVYLSFSEEDEAVAKVIREKLSGAKDSIRIYDSSKQELNKENVFQEDMYALMTKSARVVTVLSPNYLQNKACMEQYNIALCCNRRANRDILAPVYVNSVDLMPTYMGLVQYVDCRPADESKIQDACSQLGVSLTVKLHRELSMADFDPLRYDIFLSYSHRDTEKANRFVATLKKLAPDLKLFFDVQELKTGKSWQRTLYHSIDGSRCMLALLSTPYLKSAVCQEEFALAQAKHFTKGMQRLQLIPICLEDLGSIPSEFVHTPMVKATPDVFEDTVQTVCPAVVQWLKGEKVDKTEALITIFDEDEIPTIASDSEMESYRTALFQNEFGPSVVQDPASFPPALTNILPSMQQESAATGANTQAERDITCIFSFHSEDQKYVDVAASMLKDAAPWLKVSGTVASNRENKLQALEKASCIIPILSPHYLENPECVEEFHVGIWRQRISDPDAPLLFPIQVHELPQKPAYFHLVKCEVNVTDALWAHVISDMNSSHTDLKKMFSKGDERGLLCTVSLALRMGIYKILRRLVPMSSSSPGEHPPRPALINVMNLREQTKQINQPDYTEDVCQKLLELTTVGKS